jgi:hypothetical protein
MAVDSAQLFHKIKPALFPPYIRTRTPRHTSTHPFLFILIDLHRPVGQSTPLASPASPMRAR